VAVGLLVLSVCAACLLCALQMKKLTDIVWPEMRRLALEQIEQLAAQGYARGAGRADLSSSTRLSLCARARLTVCAASPPRSFKIIVIEAAVLIEAGWTSAVDEVAPSLFLAACQSCRL
jgi:hypothetical protein